MEEAAWHIVGPLQCQMNKQATTWEGTRNVHGSSLGESVTCQLSDSPAPALAWFQGETRFPLGFGKGRGYSSSILRAGWDVGRILEWVSNPQARILACNPGLHHGHLLKPSLKMESGITHGREQTIKKHWGGAQHNGVNIPWWWMRASALRAHGPDRQLSHVKFWTTPSKFSSSPSTSLLDVGRRCVSRACVRPGEKKCLWINIRRW